MFLPLPSEVVFCVVCSGGVGSKMLIKALRTSTHRHEPGAGEIMATHSHLRTPPRTLHESTRVLYMFGDPRDAVVSFFDRRKSRHDRHGFNARVIDKPDDSWVMEHCANIGSTACDMDETWDLHRFLENGQEYFRLEEHFDNWFYSDMEYDIVFVRYENIWSNKKALGKMLCLNMEKFPEKVERRSKWIDLDSKDKAMCDEIFGSFARRLNQLPDIFTVSQGEIIPCSYLQGALR